MSGEDVRWIVLGILAVVAALVCIWGWLKVKDIDH